jgi:hypothetical protein
MPSRRSRPDLTGLLNQQYGLVRRDQALGCAPGVTQPGVTQPGVTQPGGSAESGGGLTKGALRWRLEKGLWQIVLPAVYATQSGPLTPEQRAFASLLYAGESAQLTGPVAGHLLGLRYAPPADLVHVLIPDHRRLSPAGFAAVSRTHRLDPAASTVGGMAVVSVVRAVADTIRMVAGLPADGAQALVAEAVQRRLATPEQFEAELADGPKRGRAPLREALSAVVAGLRSAPQAKLRDLCRTSPALPEIAWHPRLAAPDGEPLPTPDGWIADTAIALEITEPDPSPPVWAGRLRRHQDFAEHGILVLAFTANEIRFDPAGVLGTIVRAYLDRARAGVRHGVRLLV